MKRTLMTIALGLGLLSSGVLAGTAQAQEEYEDVDAPPPEYIATARPIFHEGRWAYWYNNRWFYRNGARWRAWRVEPRYLNEYRVRREPVRYNYGRGRRW